MDYIDRPSFESFDINVRVKAGIGRGAKVKPTIEKPSVGARNTDDVKPILRCKHPGKDAKAGNYEVAKAKTISKVSRDRQPRIGQTPEEFRRQNETDILSLIIQTFERELGCHPGLLDLLCHFSRAEIDAVWDQLIFLYPDLCNNGTTSNPELVVA